MLALTLCLLVPVSIPAVRGQTMGQTALKPVPRFGSQMVKPETAPQNATWNLTWRAAKERDAVPRRPGRDLASSGRHRAARSIPTRLRPVATAPRLRPVRAVAWQTTGEAEQFGETLISPQDPPAAENRSPDFFDDPFGDDAPVDDQLFAPAPQPSPPQREALIPPPTAPEQSSEPALPNQLRGAQPPAQPPRRNLFEQAEPPIPTPPSPPQTLPTPPAELPIPEPEAEMPQPGEPQPPQNEMRPPEQPAPNVEPLPPPRDLDSQQPSEDENPFGRRRDREQESARDRMDLDDLLQSEPDEEEREADDTDTMLRDDELEVPGKIDCNKFRQRIAEQTIDQVSLDISPPYRPDEINLEKYEELKADFDEKQPIRDWRTIDGSPMASGRLRDLAYEKAIIETERGTTEAVPIDRLSEGDLAFIAEQWGLPVECLLEQTEPTPRSWVSTTMTWKASNLCHTPLYFEDVNLERYGHTHGPVVEPFVQSAHFFGNVIVLPYKMGVHSPHECIYALGYYRPGSCAPWIKQPVPISAKGAITQAVTTMGLFWLIP